MNDIRISLENIIGRRIPWYENEDGSVEMATNPEHIYILKKEGKGFILYHKERNRVFVKARFRDKAELLKNLPDWISSLLYF